MFLCRIQPRKYVLNEKFNTSFNRKSLTELFRSNGLKLSQQIDKVTDNK